MAIGDTPNQNLFGTNYNAEEEERKKAELAAQGARIGAGNVPASAFGQAPAVAPFSMEAAGQVNPMMEQQSLESFAQPQVTFRDYDVPEPPRASALSVFTPGGEVKPGIDVNAITPSPETTPEAAPKNALLEMLERADERQSMGLPRQAAPGIIDAPVESPLPMAQEQPEPVVSPFLQSPDTPSGLGGPLLRGFEMVNDAARGPNAPMGQDATRAALGGMTLNEYLNAPAGTPGVSGLRTDPQGRMISSPAPAVANNFAPQASGGQVGPAKVSDEIMSQVARPAGQTAEFRDGNRDGIEDREQGIFRPGELIGYDAQGNEVRSPGTQQPVNRIPATAQPPVDALSSFEQASLERQQRIGGTGSFEGDSAAREARLKANERQPGESQTERDTRVAQSRTTGSQAGGMSFDDARRRAKSQLAERGVKNPSVSMVNDLARGIQAGEPERLAELETKKALDAIKLRDAEAKKDFKPQIVEIGDQKLIQLSPNYYQPVRPEPTAEEPFEPRVLEEGGFTYYEVAPNRFERQPSTKVGGATGEVSSAIADAIAAGGEEVTATPAPTSTSPAPVRINSQAEYDALPVGTLYIDSQGTETVKK